MTGFASGALYPVPRCAKLLLEAGATVNLAARDSEVTPLHVAAARGLEKHVANFGFLFRGERGERLLHTRICSGSCPKDEKVFSLSSPTVHTQRPVVLVGRVWEHFWKKISLC